MSKLIIIRGNSGSGKSTVAKALQQKIGRNTMLISQDMVRREILWAKDGAGTTKLPLMINMLQYGRQHCEVVIMEGILCASWYRELFETAMQEFHSNIFAYYYNLPFEETVLRHQTRAKQSAFGEAEMKCWWNEKDYIGFIPEKIFTKETSLDEAVDLIYSDISAKEKDS